MCWCQAGNVPSFTVGVRLPVATSNPQMPPRIGGFSCYRFTTLIVIDDGYWREWWTSLCATTPSVSS